MKKNVEPMVSVVIPVKEVNYFIIFENLPAFVNQTYKNFEVIVLPNEHSQYDLELLKKYKWLRIVPTGKVTRPAEKRDIGVKNAKGTIIAFIDDDAYPTSTWLENAIAVFNDKKTEAVAGPGILPERADYWERVFDEVLKTRVGSGGYSYRFIPGKPQYVDDYPSMNFLIQKKVFEKLGGFNSEYWPGEDSKLCNDLVYKENGKIFYHPSVVIHHHRRNELWGYLKQHGNYGYHRGAFFAHGDENSKRLVYLVPTGFLLYLIFLVIVNIPPVSFLLPVFILNVFLFPLVLYLVGILYLFLAALLNTNDVLIALGSALVLFLTHVYYGIMFIKGYFKGKAKKANIYD